MSSNPLSPFVPPVPGHSPFDVIKHLRPDGSEYWSAREMMPIQGYSLWQNFTRLVREVESGIRDSGLNPADHVIAVNNMVEIGSGALRERADYHLSRWACYHVAMAGDGSKPEVRAARSYFAFMTRKAETETDLYVSPPWAARIKETVIPHLRHLNIYHLGCWSVISSLVPHMILLEEELRLHRMPTKSSDLPDDSVGSRWAHHRKKLELAPSDLRAPLTFPNRPKPVHVLVYGGEERPAFDKWFADTYLNTGLQSYLDGKPEFKPFDPCARASVATNVSEGLRGVPALIRCDHARRIARAGGRFVAGRPALEYSQKDLF